MFSYFGCKSKLVTKYPIPTESLIIEPFAGSARYALRYWQHDVWLNDAYPVIADIWNWLKAASIADVEQLPELKRGEDLRDCTYLSDVERQLMGFMVNSGSATPCNIVSTWSDAECVIAATKKRILKNLEKIRHWKITCADYRTIPNDKATWFIDPPYIGRGRYYKFNTIDYVALSEWCKQRKGQSIVCESDEADWLPFRSLCQVQGQRSYNRTELIWTNLA